VAREPCALIVVALLTWRIQGDLFISTISLPLLHCTR